MTKNPLSLMMFDREQFPRKEAIAIMNDKNFNNMIFVSIIVNCLLMAALYDPLDENANAALSDGTDVFFTFLFMFEMFVKICASGLLFGEEAYLRNGWNILDGIVVIISFVCLDFVSGGAEGLNSLRAIRAVRPLRTLSRFKSGALFVNTLFSSAQYIMNVFIFLVWFIILGACAGTVLFRGELRSRCFDISANTDPNTCPSADALYAGAIESPARYEALTDGGDDVICGISLDNCPVATHTCCDYAKHGEMPSNGYVKFDNVLWSSLLVLQGLTIDGWNETAYMLMDAIGWPVLLWYALMVCVGAFFVMQLLSAVVVTSLQTCSAEQKMVDQMEAEREKRRIEAGGDPLDKGDGDAIDAMGKTWRTSKSLAGVRKLVRLHMPAVHKIAESEKFNNVILVVIALNTVVMMTRHYPESDDFADANVVMEYCFNGIFIAEFVIKHLGYGLGGYWSVGWNRLDGFVVISSMVDMAGSAINLGFIRALRVLRVVRTVRVLKAAPEAMAVITAMVTSLASMTGFLLVWLIFMLIYALLGTRLYGSACVFEIDEDAGRLSFRSFMRAMLTLFVTASGENGFDVIHWTMEAEGPAASMFMISWMFISQILLALLLALLIDTYTVGGDEEEEDEGPTPPKGVATTHKEGYEMGPMDSGARPRRLSEELVDMEEEDRRVSLSEEEEDERRRRREERRDERRAYDNGDAKTWTSRDNLSETSTPQGTIIAPPRSHRGTEPTEMKTTARHGNHYHKTPGSLVEKYSQAGYSQARSGKGGTQDRHHDPHSPDTGALKKQLDELYDEKAADAADAAPQTRLQQLQNLKRHKVMHEVAVVRQWLYDIDYDYDRSVEQPLPIRMTATQEQKAKDRLSLRKNFNWSKAKAQKMEFKRLALTPFTQTPTGEQMNMGSMPKSLKALRDGEDLGQDKSKSMKALDEFVDSHQQPQEKTVWLQIVEDNRFGNFILVCILWSSIMLAMETPNWPTEGSGAARVFYVTDIILTIIFTFEMGIQWMAIGIGPYFRQLANKLDFIIVVSAWLSLILSWAGLDASTLTALRSLRLLRILRPLRAIRRLPALRMVVDCTVGALPAIKWIMVLGAFLAMILGLFGMQFFGGKFWSCHFVPDVNDASVYEAKSTQATCEAFGGIWAQRTLTTCEHDAAIDESGDPLWPVASFECGMPPVVTKADCAALNGTWRNSEYNFDNIGQALVVVFITSTADNWQDVMYTGIDAVDVDKNPVYDENPWASAYFVLVTMLSCFFWANMFVSTLVDQYTKASENEGVIAMANEHSATLDKALMLARTQAEKEKHWAERKTKSNFVKVCIAIASHRMFNPIMMGVIMLNGFALMCIHADQPGWMDDVDFYSGICFQTIYCFEVVVLMTAMTPEAYLSDPWCRFDLVIVAAGVVELSVPGDAGFVAVLRTFRFLRLFKIIKGFKELRVLMYTILSAIPGVSNIGLLLFLLMFMYACLGVTLYGDIDAPYGFPNGLNKYTNFRNWPNAMLLLFVMFTGNWESIFRATYWDCEGDEGDWGRECSYRYSAPFYFFSYFLMANAVLANLFVSIILDKFTCETASEEESTNFIEVVHVAFLVNNFRNMLTNKIRIYQLLRGRADRRTLKRYRKRYARILPPGCLDEGHYRHGEALKILRSIKDVKSIISAPRDGEETRDGSPNTVLPSAQQSAAALTIVPDDEAKEDRIYGSETESGVGPAIDDEEYDSFDGDDLASRYSQDGGGNNGDWLSSCNFNIIPQLDYCYHPPPHRDHRHMQNEEDTMEMEEERAEPENNRGNERRSHRDGREERRDTDRRRDERRRGDDRDDRREPRRSRGDRL